MNREITILLKKLVAFFFLAIFVTVFAVKLAHHHPYSYTITKANGLGKELVFKSDCSICDYCFVKDSHNETAFVSMEAPLFITPFYTDYLSRNLTFIGLSSFDRGPPAVA